MTEGIAAITVLDLALLSNVVNALVETAVVSLMKEEAEVEVEVMIVEEVDVVMGVRDCQRIDMSMFRGLLLYTAVVIFHIEWCIRKP